MLLWNTTTTKKKKSTFPEYVPVLSDCIKALLLEKSFVQMDSADDL